MISHLLARIIDSTAGAVFENVDILTELDMPIGDGDHGINMERGFKAAQSQRDKLAEFSFSKALQKIGSTLVMNIGGASGPLYGSLCITMGKAAERESIDVAGVARIFSEGVEAVKRRGKSDSGEKTLLDVLVPVSQALQKAVDDKLSLAETLDAVRAAADQGLESTRDMVATKGRAAFLGARSAGHLDPGAKSSQVLIHAVCQSIAQHQELDREDRPAPSCVGIVVVSHSADVARGAVDMVHHMVGDEVPMAWCGGDPVQRRGTDVAAIKNAIEKVWSPAGVAILVDLGGSETNSEMAIEMLPPGWQNRVVICNAPIVEGTVMAATEAAGGGTLEQVRATAEDMGAF
jgi:dihydroxyacetone kinase-like protein